MASKVSPVTPTHINTKLNDSIAEINENSRSGIINEVLQDDVFSDGTKSEFTEEIVKQRLQGDSIPNVADDHISQKNNVFRKKSVLKRIDSNKPKPIFQKRVSFSSAEETKRRISNATDCFTYMQMGTEFLKLRLGREYQRKYHLDHDFECLHWRPSSKRPDKAVLPVEALHEVRAGKNTTIFKEQGSAYSEDCCFSLICGPNYDSVDLVAKTSEEASIWITGLRLLLTHADQHNEEEEDNGDMRERWLRHNFRLLDKEKVGVLSESSIMNLLKKLRVNVPEHIVKHKLQEVHLQSVTASLLSDNTENFLSENDFCKFFIELTTRQEIYFLLVKYSSNGSHLTKEDLMIFLETEQGLISASLEQSLDIINRCEPTEEGRKKQILGLDGLTEYFFEEDCSIFKAEHESVCEDMKKPLSHYFIAASNNTYLIEDQLTGKSSVEGFVSCLQRGCRYIELECYDGDEGEPSIYHGNNCTLKLPFLDTIKVIAENAFYSTDYPLILSIENHCSTKQQLVMAQHLKMVFRDCLYDIPADEQYIHLPSPHFLRGKVIIKSKKLAFKSSESISSNGDVSEEEEEKEIYSGDNTELVDNEVNHGTGTDNDAFQKIPLTTIKSSQLNALNSPEESKNVKTIKLAKEFSDLVVLCKLVRFQNFTFSSEQQKYWEMCSFSENTARELCRTFPEELVIHNKKFLSHVYPNNVRLDSSNFNPVEFWACGCQLVAMNYQYAGIAMDINRGFFLKNGGCGYVLKPSVMREEVSYFNSNMKQEIPGVCPVTLTIKVISGYQLPKPRGSASKADTVDPYVVIEMFGLPADYRFERTKTISNNGFNPVFDETFEFRVLLPELALLRFFVLDDDHIGDCFIGQYTIPLDCVRQGYRTVYLLSSVGEKIDQASLFVHVSISRQFETNSKKGFGMKKKKDSTTLKHIGMKFIDDTFKQSLQPLREAAVLRDNFQTSLALFQESCGCARTSVKQCVRILAQRIGTTNEKNLPKGLTVKITGEKLPVLTVEGEIPHVLQKMIESFEEFLCECSNMSLHAADLYERLTHARRSALEWHDDLTKKSNKDSAKGKSNLKVIESFSWNVKVLSGQADLLKAAITQCEECKKQIIDVASTCGFSPPKEHES
ncbi:inactive phospholipase C-like protein 2 [Hydra vulgaris]|uniref:Phosphoinositide phospholipase C n=1 Tax=Hydra vulgaris TaxID=6087 RepID=A0ABM4BXE3_HYDVU